MSNSEEIEVEVVEVGESRPVSRPHQPSAAQAEPQTRGPFGTRPMRPLRPLRIPRYLWPLVVIFGLILLLVALLVLMVVVIPFLIIRAILRLLLSSLR